MTIFIVNNYMSLLKALQTLRWLAFTAIASLLMACSAVRFVYNQGDTLSRWWIDDHIGLTQEQDNLIREALDRHFWWHRTAQLQGLAATLEEMQQKLNKNISKKDVTYFYGDIKKHSYAIAHKVTPDMARLFMSLEISQIENVRKRMAQNNEKFAKEWLPKEKSEQIKVRIDKTIQRSEWFFGKLNKDQEEKIKAYILANPIDMNLIYQERLRRQEDLILVMSEIVKKKLNQKESEALITDYIKHFEYGKSKEQLEAIKKREEIALGLASFVVEIANADQKKYASERVENWVSDIRHLIKESSELAAKRSALPNR
jgi:translation elongation factor EF-1beta